MRSILLQLVPSTKWILGAMYQNQQIHQKHISKSFFSLWVYFGCIPVTKKVKTRNYAFHTTTISTINKIDTGRHVLEPTDSPETYFQVIFLTLGVFFGCIPVTKRSKLETMCSVQLQLVPSTKLI